MESLTNYLNSLSLWFLIDKMKTKREPTSFVFVNIRKDNACKSLNTDWTLVNGRYLLLLRETEYVLSKPCLCLFSVHKA